MACVYIGAFFKHTYGVFHKILHLIIFAVIAGYGLFAAAIILDQGRNYILTCTQAELNYEIFTNITNSVPSADGKGLFQAWHEPLTHFCNMYETLQAWICLIAM